MKKTIAPGSTPSPAPSFGMRVVGKTDSPTSVFVVMALDMSWRLAISVLVPIIGGYELDKHLKTSPWLLIIGFILAMAGMGLVMWQTLQAANNLNPPTPTERKRL